ncbi:hypothetical protein K2F54_12350 [Cryobacterium sp. 1639]|uniref:hypothetical protein n=1 Tax=Cryobacterium inferilacus TaxID=2866629 RepID=UPI001C734259|nr:hypothetical protein [Cryobacterium sp. 1639]MBX0300764.1 hypothetical protein [Cryobacterium sp. 1639]
MTILPRLTCVAFAAAATAILSSCSTATSPFLESSDGHIVVVSEDGGSGGGQQALFEGSLAWGDAGCMTTTLGAHLIVFPKGTTIDDNDEIVLPNGFHIRAGDEVGLGGGSSSPDDAKSKALEVPEECLTDEIFYASGEVAK